MAKSTFTKTARSAKTVRMNALEAIDAEFADLYAILGGAPDVAVEEDSPAVAAIESDVVMAPALSDEYDELVALEGLSEPEPTPEVVAPSAVQDDELAALEALLAPEQLPTPPVETAIDDLDDLEVLLADVTEPTPVPAGVELTMDDLEAAVNRAEATDAALAAANTDETMEGAIPTGDAAESSDAADGAAADKPKRAATPRKHYSDKVERLKDRVGDALSEYTVLTTADALVDEGELGAVMERTLEIIRAMNVKEKARASNFIEFLSGKKVKLNEVLERVLRLLDREGFLTTGNTGNVIKDLIARPYSIASARAMGGNTVGMYADLKVIIPDGKGRFVANPDSLLLAKARSLLAIAPAATAA